MKETKEKSEWDIGDTIIVIFIIFVALLAMLALFVSIEIKTDICTFNQNYPAMYNVETRMNLHSLILDGDENAKQLYREKYVTDGYYLGFSDENSYEIFCEFKQIKEPQKSEMWEFMKLSECSMENLIYEYNSYIEKYSK